MGTFLVYILESSACLTLFYLFHKWLMSRDTFHRFNRFALLGVLILSSVLPLIPTGILDGAQHPAITAEQPSPIAGIPPQDSTDHTLPFGWTLTTLMAMLFYLAGIIFFTTRYLWSLHRLYRLLHKGQTESIPDSLPVSLPRIQLIVHESDIAPFSWWHYLVLSRRDLEENGQAILIHELAHLHNRHSWDLLLADLCILIQWFNPAAWLLKRELQTIHEYEADETVLRKGVNARNYQMLLIKKAVGTRRYSMADSFNHSSLKKRITMMLKEKSSPWARAKYLYVLPLSALAITAFALPEVSAVADNISDVKISDLTEIRQTNLPETIPSENRDTVSSDIRPQNDEEQVWELVEQMPEFPGGTSAMIKYLGDNLHYPETAQKAGIQGRVIVRFIVGTDGNICQPEVVRGIEPALDAEALRVVQTMPRWKPGMNKGKAVAVKYHIPIMFSLKKTDNSTPVVPGRK